MKLYHPREVNGRMVVPVAHTGLQAEQNFNRRTFVLRGISEGWLTLSADEKVLTLHTDEGDLVYDVLKPAGYYCVSTGKRIPLSKFAEEEANTQQVAKLAAAEAQKWLKDNGLKPNDYEAPKDYKCRLRDDLHDLFRGVPGPAGSLVRVGG